MANVANIINNLLSDSGVDITTVAGLGSANTYTQDQAITSTTDSTSLTTGALKVSGGVAIVKNLFVGGNITADGNLQIDGNLIVSGTSTTINAANLAVSDNMLYMNNGIQSTVTNAVGNGTTITYTVIEHNYLVGMSVSITGVTPVGYNISNATITAVTTTTFTISNTFTGTYTSGGTARAKSNANPDVGFAAGYNDGSYKHTGLFRDASDLGIWKFFDGYTLEPDASAFIDTAHPSFALATVQAAMFKGNLTGDVTGNVTGNLTGNVTGNVSGNAGTVTNGIYTSVSYNNPDWLTGLAWSKISSVPANLTSLSSLSYGSTSFVKMTGTNTFTLDTTVYAPLSGAAFTGAISSTSTVTATTRLLVGTDASIAVANATQSAIRSYWGLQLLGNTQSSVDVAPTNIGTNSDFSVIIPNQQATKIGLIVRGATSQSGSLQEWQSVTPAVLAKVDASGNITAASFVKTSGTSSQFLKADGSVDSSSYYLASNPSGYTNNTGTVTSVTITTANGVSASVLNQGTSPAFTISLGAITPSSVNSVVISGSSTPTLAVTGTSSISGSNTGDNAVNSLYSGLVSNATHTGDATGATALTVVGLRGVTLPTLGATAGFLRYTGTGTNTWVFDTSTYLTANQSISFAPTGDVTGSASGATSLTPALTLATITQSTGANFVKITLDTKGRVSGNTAVAASDLNTTFGSQTAATFYAAPNATAGNPSFRAIVAADIPTLNQNTSGSAGSVSGTNVITNANLRQSGARSVIGNATNATANVADISTATADQVLISTATTLVWGTVTTAAITNSAVTYAKIQNVSATNRLLGRSTAGAGVVEEITVGGDLSQSGSTFTIANSAVTLAKMANLTANTIIGNNTVSAATPLALTGTQVTAMLDNFSSTLKGLVPLSGGGTTNFLRADGTWAAPPGGGGTTTNSLTFNNGGLGAASGSTFNGSTAVTISYNSIGAQGALTLTTTGSSGAATLVGNTLNIPQYSGGTSTGLTWTELTATTLTAAVNNGYIVNTSTLSTITLPTTAAIGSEIEIVGEGVGGWKIAQNGASVIIYFGNKNTTIGTTGYLQSSHQRDSIRLICVSANTDWQVISSIGNITYV